MTLDRLFVGVAVAVTLTFAAVATDEEQVRSAIDGADGGHRAVGLVLEHDSGLDAGGHIESGEGGD